MGAWRDAGTMDVAATIRRGPAIAPIDADAPAPSRWRASGVWIAPFAILLLVAIVVRAGAFGNPVIQIDEQFYLMTAGRMLHDGAIPFVDIWDRKPVGLFLLYTLAWLPGGNPVIAYQTMALLSVWGTACLIRGMAMRVGGRDGGLLAGITYIVALDLAGGQGGQSPVFYNLPVALAASIVLGALVPRDGRARNLRRPGLRAMALLGLAMQIKYTVVFEGVFMGLALLAGARRQAHPWPALATDAALWIAVALLPTLLAAAAYLAIGHFPEWWFANVASVLDRAPEASPQVARRIWRMIALVAPFALAVPLRRWIGARPTTEQARAALRFIDGWAASALLGVVLFGTWFDHYALPLFAPFAAAAAPLARRRWGRDYLLLAIGAGIVTGQALVAKGRHANGSRRELASAAQAALPFRGCAFVYEGWPAFYDAVHSCLPTTRPFPAHLHSAIEAQAIGLDPLAEVRRIMATSPERVMTMEPAIGVDNLWTRAVVYAALRQRYRPIWISPNRRGRHVVLYALRAVTPIPRSPTGSLREPRRAAPPA